jgi:hypothetical protein
LPRTPLLARNPAALAWPAPVLLGKDYTMAFTKAEERKGAKDEPKKAKAKGGRDSHKGRESKAMMEKAAEKKHPGAGTHHHHHHHH